jgi:hypothetical protein
MIVHHQRTGIVIGRVKHRIKPAAADVAALLLAHEGSCIADERFGCNASSLQVYISTIREIIEPYGYRIHRHLLEGYRLERPHRQASEEPARNTKIAATAPRACDVEA